MFVGTHARRGGADGGQPGGIARAGGGGAGDAAGQALGQSGDMMVEQIAQVNSRYLIGGTNWVGLSVPLHCSALGKVLLAYGAAQLPPGRLEHRTARTITSRAALQANMAEVRRRGYAITDEELEPGLIAVAAPVRAGGTAVVAALSVSGPASRMTGARIPDVAGSCVAQASALSAVLGHQPQREGAA
jgi:DNA-binding IclR family transcriptional regulator